MAVAVKFVDRHYAGFTINKSTVCADRFSTEAMWRALSLMAAGELTMGHSSLVSGLFDDTAERSLDRRCDSALVTLLGLEVIPVRKHLVNRLIRTATVDYPNRSGNSEVDLRFQYLAQFRVTTVMDPV